MSSIFYDFYLNAFERLIFQFLKVFYKWYLTILCCHFSVWQHSIWKLYQMLALFSIFWFWLCCMFYTQRIAMTMIAVICLSHAYCIECYDESEYRYLSVSDMKFCDVVLALLMMLLYTRRNKKSIENLWFLFFIFLNLLRLSICNGLRWLIFLNFFG